MKTRPFVLAMSLCLLLCSSLFVLPVSAKTKAAEPEKVVVEARGEGVITNGDVAAARSEARRRVMQDAVDQVYGTFIQSANETTNNQMNTDKVYAQLQGLVTEYKELSQQQEDSILTLTARCTVVKRDVGDVVGPAMLDAIGNPRVVVLVDQWIGSRKETLSPLESSIHSVFAASGYLMVDSRQLAANNKAPEALKDMEAGDTTLMRSLLSQMGADVIVYARARSVPMSKGKISGVVVHSVQNEMVLTATAVANAYQLGEVRENVKTQAVSVEAAAGKGTSALSDRLTRRLVAQIPWNILQGRRNSLAGRTLTVTVRDIPFSQTRNLINVLQDHADVETVHQREFRNKNLVLDVTAKNRAEDLALMLEKEGAEVTQVTDGSVEADWKKTSY